MVDFTDDWLAFPHPSGLLETLKPLLLERFIPIPCTTTILPGQELSMDFIGDECDGVMWARVGEVFPSTNDFPNPDVGKAGSLIMVASTIELGIWRACPVPDNGEPPSPEQNFETTRLQMADMKAMLDAICAYADAKELRVAIGSYQPIGPIGEVVGGSWSCVIGAS